MQTAYKAHSMYCSVNLTVLVQLPTPLCHCRGFESYESVSFGLLIFLKGKYAVAESFHSRDYRQTNLIGLPATQTTSHPSGNLFHVYDPALSGSEGDASCPHAYRKNDEALNAPRQSFKMYISHFLHQQLVLPPSRERNACAARRHDGRACEQ